MDYYQEIEDDDVPASKRPRTLNDETPTPTTTPLLFPPPIDPQSIGRNASTSAMFFKTRLCQGFSAGFCPYGDRCTFAHGVAELRPPPSNYQGMTFAPQWPPLPPNVTKICWMFQSHGACSYGERCTFPHVTAAEAAYARVHHHRHGNGPPIRGPAPLHSKPCFDWLSKGRCLYGDRCIFSHQPAAAGTQKSGDGVELNSSSGGVAPPPSRPIPEAADEPEIEFQAEPEPEPEPEPVSVRPVQGRGFQKMLGKKKIAGIYGDSFDEE